MATLFQAPRAPVSSTQVEKAVDAFSSMSGPPPGNPSKAELQEQPKSQGAKPSSYTVASTTTGNSAKESAVTSTSTTTNNSTNSVVGTIPAADVQRNMEAALNKNKTVEYRLGAYNQLPDEQRKAVYEKLDAKDQKNFPAPSSELERKVMAEIRDTTNTASYRGKLIAELSPGQQLNIARELGFKNTEQLLNAYEKDLRERKSGRHTAEEKKGFSAEADAIKAAEKNIASLEEKKSLIEKAKESDTTKNTARNIKDLIGIFKR